jgi:hypothetical protein
MTRRYGSILSIKVFVVVVVVVVLVILVFPFHLLTSQVRLWEIATGRQMSKWTFDTIVVKVAWNPSSDILVFAVLVAHVCFH